MESLGLWEAWELWFSGQTLDGYAIGAVPINLISRTGAVLSLLAGTVVVLDLAGADRLREWGDILRSQPLTRLRNWITDRWVVGLAVFFVLCWLAGLITETLMRLVAPILEPVRNFYVYGLPDYFDWIEISVIVILIVVGHKAQQAQRQKTAKMLWWCAALLYFLGGLPELLDFVGNIIGFLAGGLVLAGALVVLGKVTDALIFMLDLVIVRPIARALAHERPGQPIRWAGFFVLLTGQLLELVAA